MRVSFDIDDTLVCHGIEMPQEVSFLPGPIHRRISEPLRLGTTKLVRELRNRGCSVWIYTSSMRSPFYIRFWLFLHGVRIDGIVNEEKHRKNLANHKFSQLPSKYPPAFQIDLHVDDSEGVLIEGKEHNFKVLAIRPDDAHWTDKVLAAISEIKMSRKIEAGNSAG